MDQGPLVYSYIDLMFNFRRMVRDIRVLKGLPVDEDSVNDDAVKSAK